MALGKYGFKPGTGLYTDMNAVRRDEMTDALHSIYVDPVSYTHLDVYKRQREYGVDFFLRRNAGVC